MIRKRKSIRKVIAEAPASERVGRHVVKFGHYTSSAQPKRTRCNLCDTRHETGPIAFIADTADGSTGVIYICPACHQVADKEAALRAYLNNIAKADAQLAKAGPASETEH
jgi:uncharacterized protein with PIN domain